MKAIKATGMINDQGYLCLDAPLDITSQNQVEVIVLVPEEVSAETDLDDETLESAIEGFREGWRDAMTGNTIPVDQLWEGLDAD